MKKRIFSSFLISLMLFVAMSFQTFAAESSVTESDVTATITTPKDSYDFGEEVEYTITIENNRTGWTSAQSTIKYSNSGLKAYDGGELDSTVVRLATGESTTVTGTLIGEDVEIGTSHKARSFGLMEIIIIILIALAVILVIAFVVKGKSKRAKKALSCLLIICSLGTAVIISGPLTVNASDADAETVTLRPYLYINYDGSEVMIRATISLSMVQPVIKYDTSLRDSAETITCHDPSIFKDFDGTYYVFGSFLCSSISTDLHDWTCVDSTFQSTFTDEVKDAIRAWNDDESGSWNSYLWAPDVIYNEAMGKYCMYLSADGDNWKSNIVLLTSDSVDGPYDYAGSIVYGGFDETNFTETDFVEATGESTLPDRYITNGVKNKLWGDEYPNCIDPCVFYDEEGNLWMSYGSWSGGIFMLELDETTGLRDYSVSYETNEHSDAYFGTKIAGGKYVSGEASYIQHIGDYYYLFISYGNLEAQGGYNIRVFRSTRPDGDYVDELGNTPYYDTYEFNYNQSIGVRLFGGYKWRTMNNGQVAQGHNSAFVDDDGKAYIVFHTRTTDGTEGHYVKVHQLFVNKEGWLVAAPYLTNGETLSDDISSSTVAGDYDLIIHNLDIDYANLDTNKPEFITLNSDGSISGDYEGSWEMDGEYITLSFNGDTYSGVVLNQKIENTSVETVVFTALGLDSQITIWGSKSVEE